MRAQYIQKYQFRYRRDFCYFESLRELTYFNVILATPASQSHHSHGE